MHFISNHGRQHFASRAAQRHIIRSQRRVERQIKRQLNVAARRRRGSQRSVIIKNLVEYSNDNNEEVYIVRLGRKKVSFPSKIAQSSVALIGGAALLSLVAGPLLFGVATAAVGIGIVAAMGSVVFPIVLGLMVASLFGVLASLGGFLFFSTAMALPWALGIGAVFAATQLAPQFLNSDDEEDEDSDSQEYDLKDAMMEQDESHKSDLSRFDDLLRQRDRNKF